VLHNLPFVRGLPVTRPARTVSDLLHNNEDPGAVAHIITDSLRNGYESPTAVAHALAPHAGKFGLRRRDGLALLGWMLDLVGDPEGKLWISEARARTGSELPQVPSTRYRDLVDLIDPLLQGTARGHWDHEHGSWTTELKRQAG
jgi:hypothetical protein